MMLAATGLRARTVGAAIDLSVGALVETEYDDEPGTFHARLILRVVVPDFWSA